MKRLVITLMMALAPAAWAAEAPKEEGFARLFDGRSLKGWVRRNEAGHGWGAVWRVTGGAIDGVQEWPGARGLLVARRRFGSFDLRLEAKTDWPVDGGVLLRLAGGGRAYQVPIHCRPDGDVGGVASVDIGDFRATAKNWKKTWRKDGWNRLRIVIKGNPPEIHTWLNGKRMADFKHDVKTPPLPGKGSIALRIHGGEDAFNNHVFFRNIRIREIK